MLINPELFSNVSGLGFGLGLEKIFGPRPRPRPRPHSFWPRPRPWCHAQLVSLTSLVRATLKYDEPEVEIVARGRSPSTTYYTEGYHISMPLDRALSALSYDNQLYMDGKVMKNPLVTYSATQ